MYNELMRKKSQLEKELKILAQQTYELEMALESARKALKDKEKEIYDVLGQMEDAKIQLRQQRAEKREEEMKATAKKIADVKDILASKTFYKSIRKHIPEPHWKKLNKAIQSEEFLSFILKNHYANRLIKAYQNDTELNQSIMEAIVSKLRKLIK